MDKRDATARTCITEVSNLFEGCQEQGGSDVLENEHHYKYLQRTNSYIINTNN